MITGVGGTAPKVVPGSLPLATHSEKLSVRLPHLTPPVLAPGGASNVLFARRIWLISAGPGAQSEPRSR
jgi:hypothetical protein